MPNNIPVSTGGFVEKNAAHGETLRAKNRTDEGADQWRLGKRCHCVRAHCVRNNRKAVSLNRSD